MTVGPLVTEIIITFFIVAYLLRKYGNWGRHHILVTINVFIAWYFAFIIIFILPLDVSSAVYRQCLKDKALQPKIIVSCKNESDPDNALCLDQNNTSSQIDEDQEIGCEPPWSYVPDNVLPSLWRVVYWTAQALTWIILPLMQSYSTAGDFTVSGKLKTAVTENVTYYASYLLLFGSLFVYVAVRSGIIIYGPNLKVICITASNTWGLFLLVLLLGYGLVEIPRSFWYTTKKDYTLNHLYFQASKLSTEKCEAEEKVDDLLEEHQRLSECVPPTHPIQQYIDIIYEKFPESKKTSHPRRSSDDNQSFAEDISMKSLAKLHKQVIRATQMYNRTQVQWNNLLERAFHWEDVSHNEINRDRQFKHLFPPQRQAIIRLLYTPKVEWYWNYVFRKWIYRSLCVTLATFSGIIVWSEMTFFNQKPTLTLFAIFVRLAKTNYIWIEIISVATIAYLCICAYSTVFRIRVLNFYYLAAHHQTNEYSLIFCGMMLCRLTPPLCLNFLGLIHLDSHVTKSSGIEETAYTRIMGHLDIIPIISDFFNIYFPIIVVFVCVATYFSLGSRFLHMIGFEQFVENDDVTTDLVEEGRNLIERERNRRLRAEGVDIRRRQAKSNIPYASRRPNFMNSSNLIRTSSEESACYELLQNVEHANSGI